jgi:hypothetical protein
MGERDRMGHQPTANMKTEIFLGYAGMSDNGADLA